MATFNLSDLSLMFPTVYRDIRSQIQRKAPFLRMIPIKPIDAGNQNTTFEVQFSGQNATEVDADGGSFTTATSDVYVGASLVPAAMAAGTKVSTRAQWAAANAAPAFPAVLGDLFKKNIVDATERLVKLINSRCIDGSGGGSPAQMYGLRKAVLATGTYAGLAQGTYASWASTVDSNSGTKRPLTLQLIKKTCATIAGNAKMGRPDIALCPPAVFDAVEALFEASQQINFMQPVGGGASVSMSGTPQRFEMNPGKIYTVGGAIQRDGFRVLRWENQNLTFVEDPDCANSDQTNTTSIMYLLNSGCIEFQYLPPPGSPQLYLTDGTISAAEQDIGPLANLPIAYVTESRTAYADQGDLLVIGSVVCKSRNSCGLIADIATL